MNDFDEFAEVAVAFFAALVGLIWLLTYLESTLVEPARQKRVDTRMRRRKQQASAAPPDDEQPD
jgi:hypothetical protein